MIHGEVEGRIVDEGVQEMKDEDLSDEEDMYEKIPKVRNDKEIRKRSINV